MRSAALPAYPGAALSQPEAQPTELCWWGAGVTPPACVTSWAPCSSFCSIAHHSAPSTRTTPHFSPNRRPQLVLGTAQTHLLQAALRRLHPVRSAPRGAPTQRPTQCWRSCAVYSTLHAECLPCALRCYRPLTSDGAEGSARPRPGTAHAQRQWVWLPLPGAPCEQHKTMKCPIKQRHTITWPDPGLSGSNAGAGSPLGTSIPPPPHTLPRQVPQTPGVRTLYRRLRS